MPCTSPRLFDAGAPAGAQLTIEGSTLLMGAMPTSVPVRPPRYQRTRADLRSRRGALSATLARHGLALDESVLDDTRRTLIKQRRPATGTRAARALRRLDEVLDDLQRRLAAQA